MYMLHTFPVLPISGKFQFGFGLSLLPINPLICVYNTLHHCYSRFLVFYFVFRILVFILSFVLFFTNVFTVGEKNVTRFQIGLRNLDKICHNIVLAENQLTSVDLLFGRIKRLVVIYCQTYMVYQFCVLIKKIC